MAGIDRQKLQVEVDTGNSLNGWKVRECWAKEDEAWLRMVGREENSDYPFPRLGQSVFVDDEARELNKPVICRDMFWSQDGTSFVTVHDDYGIRQYLVPDHGTAGEPKKELVPFTRAFKNQSIVSCRAHPGYSLFNDSDESNLILLAMRGIPLQLCPLRSDGGDLRAIRSFDVSSSTSETLSVPHAIDFHGKDHFLAGFDRNRVCFYDSNRSSPIWTTQSTKKGCGSSVHRAIVSCFDEAATGVVPEDGTRVFGTYKNELYRVDVRNSKEQFLRRLEFGKGIIQILKSINGHYLFILKRNSRVIDILDVRQSFKKVNELELPFKLGTQKFKASLTAATGLTIGTDYGSVLNWSRDLIEFGGNDKKSVEHLEPQNLGAEALDWECTSPYDSSRINLIQESPAEPGLFLMSYSPDKFAEPSTGGLSGIGIACRPTG